MENNLTIKITNIYTYLLINYENKYILLWNLNIIFNIKQYKTLLTIIKHNLLWSWNIY